MPYIHFTEEQKLRASRVDLPEFLRRQGENLIRSGSEFRMASDHSVTIRGNEWYDHESNQGGGPISFVQTRYGMSYPDAVTRLLEGERGLVRSLAPEANAERKRDFLPPLANREMRRVFSYLLQKRLISREVLTAFVREGLVYEDANYHNAVFIGKDEHGVVRHAHQRSTGDRGRPFRANTLGSDPRYSFHWGGTSNRLYVFEAPIDLLSFLTLYPKDWQAHSYVALCGVGERALLWMLEQHPEIRHAILCLDHDLAGIEAAGRLAELISCQGQVHPSVLRPRYKDWNEDLKAQHGWRPSPPGSTRSWPPRPRYAAASAPSASPPSRTAWTWNFPACWSSAAAICAVAGLSRPRTARNVWRRWPWPPAAWNCGSWASGSMTGRLNRPCASAFRPIETAAACPTP